MTKMNVLDHKIIQDGVCWIAIISCSAIVLGCSGEISQGGRTTSKGVRSATFHAVTNSGEAPRFRIESLRGSSGKEMSSHCRKAICTDLTLDVYSYRLVVEQNGRIVEGKVVLTKPKEWVIVNLGPAVGTAGDFEGTDIKGKIRGLPQSSQPAWIQLFLVYQGGLRTAEIDRDGGFTLYSVLPGNWVVVVLQGDQVLHTELYAHTNGTSMEIDLRK